VHLEGFFFNSLLSSLMHGTMNLKLSVMFVFSIMLPACRPNFAEAARTTWEVELLFCERDKLGIQIGMEAVQMSAERNTSGLEWQ
jgi:hypothetical protein